MALPTQNWYASWFDTPYYHILYKDRGYDEAQAFMRALMAYLKPKDSAKILDLACGKGRHSVFLNSLGYNVTGVDLSKNSIRTRMMLFLIYLQALVILKMMKII